MSHNPSNTWMTPTQTLSDGTARGNAGPIAADVRQNLRLVREILAREREVAAEDPRLTDDWYARESLGEESPSTSGGARGQLPKLKDLRIIAVDDARISAAWRNTYIIYWFGALTVENQNLLESELKELNATTSGGVGLVTIMGKSSQPPTDVVRKASAEGLKRCEPFLKYVAVVIERTGFLAAAIRSVATGIMMIADQAVPTRIFGALDDGASWIARSLSTHLKIPTTDGDVLEVAQALRTEVAAARPT